MALTIKQLRHAEALARHRRFGAAAEELRLTQPALTRSIAALEQSLGMQLFDRLARSVEPTEAGQRVLQHARAILGETLALEQNLNELSGLGQGSVSIAAGPYPAHLLVPQAAARLLRDHSNAAVDLRDIQWTDAADCITERRADIVVAEIADLAEDERLKVCPFVTSPVHFLCRSGHELQSRARLNLADVMAYPLIGMEAPQRFTPILGKHPAAGSVDARSGRFTTRIQVSGLSTAIYLACHTDTVLLSPLVVAEPQLLAGELVALPVSGNTMHLNTGMIYLRHRSQSPLAARAIELILQEREAMDLREEELVQRFLPGTPQASAGVESRPG